MKKIIKISLLTFSLAALVLLSCSNETTKDSEIAIASKTSYTNTLKRYAVQSGIVKYTMKTTGKVMGATIKGNGTSSLVFKNWGALELVEEESSQTTHTKIFGNEKTSITTNHTMNKLENGKSYSVDYKNASIYLSRDPAMEYMKQTNTDVGEAGKAMLESMGGKKIGNETFLGYNCEIWGAMGSKQWIHKGVTLKVTTTIMGITTVKEATSAKFNTSIPNSAFDLPDFPIIKSDGYRSDAEYTKDNKEMQQNITKMKKMSYAEFKAKLIQEDPEAKDMSEEEIKQNYQMMQIVLKKMGK